MKNGLATLRASKKSRIRWTLKLDFEIAKATAKIKLYKGEEMNKGC